jgi:DNA polymerase I-like protein with 3'-5' exonuclease and polymerase domains
MRIAAVRSNDTALLAMFEAGKDCYDALGVAVLPAAPDRAAVRKAMKRSALSLINGSGAGRIAEYLKGLSSDPVKDARALINHWNETYPDLAAYIGDRLEAIEAAGDSFELETLTGRVVHIDHGGNNLTALSAHWSVVEAEAMDLALSRLPEAIGKLAGRLVLPMYDGLLLDAPRSKARAVAAAVADLMTRAMTKAGVPGVTVKVEARDRWAGKQRTSANRTTSHGGTSRPFWMRCSIRTGRSPRRSPLCRADTAPTEAERSATTPSCWPIRLLTSAGPI